MFLTDLCRHIDVPHEMDFMAVSSYGRGVTESRGEVRVDMDLMVGVAGKDVDLNEKFRNIPFIGVVNLEAMQADNE